MLTLYQGPRMWGSVNMSPFCCKVETYLRMAGVAYEIAPFDRGAAPRGKMPYADIEGERITDSALILRKVKALHGDRLDEALSPAQRAVGRSFCRMLEEGTYWVGLYLRWGTDEGFEHVKAPLGAMMPAVLRPLGLPLVRGKVLKQLHGQGTGRHAHDDIVAMGRDDLQALSDHMGEQAYLLGDTATSYDATVFAFMQSLLNVPFDSPLAAFGEALPNLRSYERRMFERFYPDGVESEF